MFLTDLAGSIYSAKLDGTEKKPLLVAQGQLTGIAYAEIPKAVKALNRKTSNQTKSEKNNYVIQQTN
jgi:hypothetical protein